MMVEGLEFPDAEIRESEIMPLARKLATTRNSAFEATMNDYSAQTIASLDRELELLAGHEWYAEANRLLVWDPRGAYWKVQR